MLRSRAFGDNHFGALDGRGPSGTGQKSTSVHTVLRFTAGAVESRMRARVCASAGPGSKGGPRGLNNPIPLTQAL